MDRLTDHDRVGVQADSPPQEVDIGQGVLFDTTIYGRVARESLVTRIGYSGTDFTQNVVRLLSEERITQTIERPQSICKITGLPTAVPTQAPAKSTGRN